MRELIELVAALRGVPVPTGALRERLGLTLMWHQMLAALLHERAAAGAGAVVATSDAGFAASLGGTRHRLAAARLTAEG